MRAPRQSADGDMVQEAPRAHDGEGQVFGADLRDM